eukprot:Rmarinus@m.12999
MSIAPTPFAILCATEYSQTIWEAMLAREVAYQPDPEYILRVQRGITESIRRTIVDDIFVVGEEQYLNLETIALAVNYCDRYMSTVPFKPQFQDYLVLCSVVLASKVAEFQPPTAADVAHWLDLCEWSKKVCNVGAENVKHTRLAAATTDCGQLLPSNLVDL